MPELQTVAVKIIKAITFKTSTVWQLLLVVVILVFVIVILCIILFLHCFFVSSWSCGSCSGYATSSCCSCSSGSTLGFSSNDSVWGMSPISSSLSTPWVPVPESQPRPWNMYHLIQYRLLNGKTTTTVQNKGAPTQVSPHCEISRWPYLSHPPCLRHHHHHQSPDQM